MVTSGLLFVILSDKKIKHPARPERGVQLGVILFQPSGKQAIQENGPGWRARMTIFFTFSSL
jgi:hypothetical protein